MKHKLRFELEVNAPLVALWQFHASVDALQLLTPPGTRVEIVGKVEPAHLGVIYHLKIKRGPITMHWDAEYLEFNPPNGFVDRQIPAKGPFKFWKHEHRLTATETGSKLVDEIEYELPFGVFGEIANALFVRRDIVKMFAHRHKVTKQQVERK